MRLDVVGEEWLDHSRRGERGSGYSQTYLLKGWFGEDPSKKGDGLRGMREGGAWRLRRGGPPIFEKIHGGHWGRKGTTDDSKREGKVSCAGGKRFYLDLWDCPEKEWACCRSGEKKKEGRNAQTRGGGA